MKSFQLQLGSTPYDIQASKEGGRYRISINSKTYIVDRHAPGGAIGALSTDNHRMIQSQSTVKGNTIATTIHHRLYIFEVIDRHALSLDNSGPSTSGGHNVISQMPGRIIAIKGEVGTCVEKGYPLIIMEAMKMQNELKAPISGTIRTIHVRPQQAVEGGELLLEIEPNA